MVRTRSGKGVNDDVPESSNRHRGTFHPHVPPPSSPAPPVSLEQLLAPFNAIVQRLAAIDEWQVVQSQPHQQHQESSYFDLLVMQPPEFAEMTDPLEDNHWLRVNESKFRLLHCSELQKTLFTAQQLCGPAMAWWAMYTAALRDNHQVSWSEFCKAFREHHILAGIVHHKLREFLHL
jgi:hypothetical protein